MGESVTNEAVPPVSVDPPVETTVNSASATSPEGANAEVAGQSEQESKIGEKKKREPMLWYVKLCWAAMMIGATLYTGSLFGFAPMQLLLQDEGQYEELCTAQELQDGFCADQQNRLQLMYTAASLTFGLVNFPGGLFLDHFGPTKTVLVSGVAVVGGYFLFAFAESKTFDVFVPAFVILSIGGSMLQLAAMVSGFLTTDIELRSIYVTVNNCLFDSSSVIYLLFFFWNKETGVSRQTMLIVFAVVGVLVYVVMFIGWALSHHVLATARDQQNQGKSDLEHREREEDKKDKLEKERLEKEAEEEEEENDGKDLTVVIPGLPGEVAIVHVVDDKKRTLHAEDDVYLRNLSFKQQVKTYPFAYIACVMAIQVPRIIMYLGTAEDQLRYISDEDAETYVTVFSLMNPASFILAPFIAPFLSKHTFAQSFFIVHCLMTGFGVCIMIPIIEIQILAFTFFTIARSFIFSTLAFTILQVNGPNSMGKSFGTLQIVASVMAFLYFLGVVWTNNTQSGDFFKLNLLLLCLSLPLFPMTYVLGRWEEKNRKGPLTRREELALLSSSKINPATAATSSVSSIDR